MKPKTGVSIILPDFVGDMFMTYIANAIFHTHCVFFYVSRTNTKRDGSSPSVKNFGGLGHLLYIFLNIPPARWTFTTEEIGHKCCVIQRFGLYLTIKIPNKIIPQKE